MLCEEPFDKHISAVNDKEAALFIKTRSSLMI
jgi:hypothetical protein